MVGKPLLIVRIHYCVVRGVFQHYQSNLCIVEEIVCFGEYRRSTLAIILGLSGGAGSGLQAGKSRCPPVPPHGGKPLDDRAT